MKIEGELQSIVILPNYPFLGIYVFVSADDEARTYYIKPPEHTYGAITCDGRQVATLRQLFEWLTTEQLPKYHTGVHAVLYVYDEGQKNVAGNAEFTRLVGAAETHAVNLPMGEVDTVDSAGNLLSRRNVPPPTPVDPKFAVHPGDGTYVNPQPSLPTILGGTSVGQTNPPDPESLAEKDARDRKAGRS